MRAVRLLALLTVAAVAAAGSARAEVPPGLLEFHDLARARAMAPADEDKLTVVCAERLRGDGVPAGYEGLWLSFLTTESGRVQIAALTKAPIKQPTAVIALKPRYNPLPTARVGPSGTLDWAYVYDRNGDGRIDYLVYLQNAHAALPDPVPAGFPKPEPQPDGSLRVSKDLLYAMIERAQMVFRHYADDGFDGRVDAAVVEEFDAERPMFVRGYVAYRAARAGRAEAAWAFRASIGEPTRTLAPDPERGYLLPTPEPGRTEPAADRLAQGTRMLGLFNGALARCRPDVGTVERGTR
jgi:hypothetical protein